MQKPITIVIDFDGTVVTHDFPNIGQSIGAEPVLKKLVENGHKLILFTMRSDVESPVSDDPAIIPKPGNYLTDAVNWFKERDIPLYGTQTNPTQKNWTSSPKAYGELIIDDAALGAPLYSSLPGVTERPFINWDKVEKMLISMGLIK